MPNKASYSFDPPSSKAFAYNPINISKEVVCLVEGEIIRHALYQPAVKKAAITNLNPNGDISKIWDAPFLFYDAVFRRASLLSKSQQFNIISSGLKASDHVREQDGPWIENGACTAVREYFNPRDNAGIGH